MTWAAVRIRGTVNLRPEIRDTMKLLRLTRANHLVLLPERDAFQGMLQMAKDYITWGPVEPGVLAKVLASRARLEGGRPLTDEYVKKATGLPSIEALAAAIAKGEVDLGSIREMKPVIRLPPPRRGYEGIKRTYKEGGALGYRGAAINELLLRMVERGD